MADIQRLILIRQRRLREWRRKRFQILRGCRDRLNLVRRLLYFLTTSLLGLAIIPRFFASWDEYWMLRNLWLVWGTSFLDIYLLCLAMIRKYSCMHSAPYPHALTV